MPIGININCKEHDFATWILNGEKTIETRTTPSLRPYVGKTVGIIRTGCGKAHLVGFVEIRGEIHYLSYDAFRDDYDRHRVPEGSSYDFFLDKYGYVLKCPTWLATPIPVHTRGNVARFISSYDLFHGVTEQKQAI